MKTRKRNNKPCQHRRLVDTMQLALMRATRLTPQEVSHQMAPARAAFEALRRGQAAHRQWQVMAATLTIAASIEKQGVVKGLAGMLAETDAALDAIANRAGSAEKWRAPVLRGDEIRLLGEFLHVHEFQLAQLSYREYRQACAQAVARVRCSGGVAIDLREDDYA